MVFGCFLLSVLIPAQAGEGQGYIPSVQSEADLLKIGFTESSLPGVDLSTKFILPVRDGDADLIPFVFQNVNLYKFHFEFLRGEFPDKFAGLTTTEYRRIVEQREGRLYFACVLFRFHGTPVRYGFDIFTEGGNIDELPRPEEVKWIYDHLVPRFALGDPAYSPRDSNAVKNAEGWVNPGFPISFAFGGGLPPYIPYVRAENYGRVKIFTKETFDVANESGAFSFQDIVVLDHTPSDIEGVIAGAVTETLQDGLGHLAIRTARRGSPNARIENAFEVFEPWEGKLIRFKVDTTEYSITEATTAEAEAWWASHRPKLGEIPQVDGDYSSLDAVGDVPADGSVPLLTRYGGKGSNFVRLYSVLPEEHRVPAMLVPFYYYNQFLETNRTRSLKDPGLQVTYAQYIEELIADPDFRGDSERRFNALEDLRDLMEDEGRVPSAVIAAIAARIPEVFGFTDRKVRFRSSSNVEDLLEFNGAGLYSSTSVCVADDLDSDTRGPSRCDDEESNERGIARGLKRVWASLWNFRAFEEREYYQISHVDTRMAVLVSEGFPEELANGVAFTGNPDDITDKRFIVTAQYGDTPVVFPEPGVLAEKDILTFEDGTVKGIVRAQRSNLVPTGTFVLTDEQLQLLASVMAAAEAKLRPFVEYGSHSPEEVVFDYEYKIDLQGKLRIKQVRPFLIPPQTSTPAKTYRLVVPEQTYLCASFVENRPGREILASKLRAALKPGTFELRTDGTSPADFLDTMEFSPDGPGIAPNGPGVWQAFLATDALIGPSWRFFGSQELERAGEKVTISFNIYLLIDGPEEIPIDPIGLTWVVGPHNAFIDVNFGEPQEPARHVPLLPCSLDHLPLWTEDFETASGDTAHFEERFQDLEEGTGPAELVLAEVNLAGETRTVDDFWKLAYSAGHHNDTPYPELWALWDDPIEAPEGSVYGIQILQGGRLDNPPTPTILNLIGESLLPIGSLDVVNVTRLKEGIDPLLFLRGDVDFDGQIRITDPILILRVLFQGGIKLLCQDAADVDDLGDINITDAIVLLEFLYLGGEEPPAPFPDCGFDEGFDVLPTCAGIGCN